MAGEGADNEAKKGESFENPRYWEDEFYTDVDCLYDWYSTDDWLSETLATSVVDQIRSLRGEQVDIGTLRVLDVGCGTCPLLFRLASSYGFKHLVGIDFAETAVQICQEAVKRKQQKEREVLIGESSQGGTVMGGSLGLGEAQENEEEEAEEEEDDIGEIPEDSSISFHTMDACQLPNHFSEGSFDIIVDKGCLDCFVSGEGEKKIAAYLDAVSFSLSKKGGIFVLIPVNGADIPHLLKTLQIKVDGNANHRAARNPKSASQWEQTKQLEGIERQSYQQTLFLSQVIAREEKHIFLLTKRPLPSNEELLIFCGVCGTSFPYPEGTPQLCNVCSNRMQRFALS